MNVAEIENKVKKIIEIAPLKKRFTADIVYFVDKEWNIPDYASFAAQLSEIFLNKVYAFETSNQQPVIYDCGSNVGTSIAYFKMTYPNSRVVGFEADPKIFQNLMYNIKEYTNVELHNSAVWIYNGDIVFNCQGADGGSINNHFDNSCVVKAVRLKDFLEKEEKIDFLKMDIEGAEVEVLRDCASLLCKVNQIFIEYHSIIGQKQELDVILEILTKQGFRYYLEGLSKDIQAPLLQEHSNVNMDLQVSIWGKRNNKEENFMENVLGTKENEYIYLIETLKHKNNKLKKRYKKYKRFVWLFGILLFMILGYLIYK